MSELSSSGCKSEHSNLFSLSSNKSERINQEDGLEQFIEKLKVLFNSETTSLNQLYLIIQQKAANKFFNDQLFQFDQMLSSLKQVKGNNRQMARLIGMLGVKIQKSYKQKQKQKIKDFQVIQKSFQQHEQTNPTETSEEYYNYQLKPTSPKFNQFTKKQNLVANREQKTKSYYEEYQQRNKFYEAKIKNMFNELLEIKSQINKAPEIQQRIQTSKINQQHPLHIQKLEQNIINPYIEEVQSQHKIQQAQSSMKNYLDETNQKNSQLIEHAKSISKKLQQIKKQAERYELDKINNNPKLKTSLFVKYSQNGRQEGKQIGSSFENKINIDQHQIHDFQKSSQSSLSIKEQDENNQRVKFHVDKRKQSFLQAMKNVESKVIISENQISGYKNESHINSIFGPKPNYQKEGIKDIQQPSINPFSETNSDPSSKKIVISYLNMEKLSNLSNQRNGTQLSQIYHPPAPKEIFNGKSQNNVLRIDKRKQSIHKIAPVANNFSNFHNTSIMNVKIGPETNKIISISPNVRQSFIKQTHWIAPEKRLSVNVPHRDKSNHHNEFYNQNNISYSTNSSRNSLFVQNMRPPLIRGDSSKIIYPSGQSIQYSSHQIPYHPSVPYIIQTNDNNSRFQNPQPNYAPSNQRIPKLNHSNSQIYMRMNNDSNGFAQYQNRRYSQEKHQITNPLSNTLSTNNNFFKKSMENTFTNNGLPNVQQTQSNSFYNTKNSQNFQTIKNSRKSSYTGLNMNQTVSQSNKFQQNTKLANSSRLSRQSVDSTGSRKSKSKGIQISSQGY